MEFTLLELAAIGIGFLLRLGIPILLTALLALFLKWLDRRWQAEAEADAAERAVRYALPVAERQPCWEVHRCPPGIRDKCIAYSQPETPCWELHRVDGRLKPACRNCKMPPPEIIERAVLA
ncbi:MAG: hypothetical protein R3293_15235 [Candidatus Promineifilaceae bacterium]|nr:hypothetical protein [Candidatus Promineifilaceae bacterium]